MTKALVERLRELNIFHAQAIFLAAMAVALTIASAPYSILAGMAWFGSWMAYSFARRARAALNGE